MLTRSHRARSIPHGRSCGIENKDFNQVFNLKLAA